MFLDDCDTNGQQLPFLMCDTFKINVSSDYIKGDIFFVF